MRLKYCSGCWMSTVGTAQLADCSIIRLCYWINLQCAYATQACRSDMLRNRISAVQPIIFNKNYLNSAKWAIGLISSWYVTSSSCILVILGFWWRNNEQQKTKKWHYSEASVLMVLAPLSWGPVLFITDADEAAKWSGCLRHKWQLQLPKMQNKSVRWDKNKPRMARVRLQIVTEQS